MSRTETPCVRPPSASAGYPPSSEVIPIRRAMSVKFSGPTSSPSWAKTVLTEFAVASRRLIVPLPPPVTDQISP